MRQSIAAGALLLALTACGADGDPNDEAVDRGSSDQSQTPSSAPDGLPTAIPAADGMVRTREPATVMGTAKGTMLCLGAVLESYPPQCSGPPVRRWNWDGPGLYEQQGEARWGTFAVTGSWNGKRFTVKSAISSALYDPPSEERPPLPTPARDYSQAELDDLAVKLSRTVPGVLSASADAEGHVLIDVVYDDGALQEALDANHGAGVVVVTSALVPV